MFCFEVWFSINALLLVASAHSSSSDLLNLHPRVFISASLYLFFSCHVHHTSLNCVFTYVMRFFSYCILRRLTSTWLRMKLQNHILQPSFEHDHESDPYLLVSVFCNKASYWDAIPGLSCLCHSCVHLYGYLLAWRLLGALRHHPFTKFSKGE